MSVVFRFNPRVANKELTHSFNHQVYELQGEGEFTAPDGDWLSLSKIKLDQYEGEAEARTLAELPAFELVRQEAEEAAPARRVRKQ